MTTEYQKADVIATRLERKLGYHLHHATSVILKEKSCVCSLKSLVEAQRLGSSILPKMSIASKQLLGTKNTTYSSMNRVFLANQDVAWRRQIFGFRKH